MFATQLMRLAVGVALALGAGAVSAAFPERVVRMVVAYPPGGATDLLARVLATELSKKWGQQVIVENKPGASGMLAAEQISRATPDGYTLLMGYTPEVMLNKLVFKQMRYDPATDLTPIALAASAPLVLVAGPRLPVSDFAGLLSQKRKALTYASPGAGGQQHIAGEMLAQMGGLDLTHVPYRGTGPAVTDLLGGQVDMFFATIPPLQQHIVAGKLRPLFVAGPVREKLLPDVPTASEVGLSKLQLSNWFGLFGPKGLPGPLVETLASDVAQALSQPTVVRSLEDLGLTVNPLRGAAFRAFMESEMTRYRTIIAETGISAD
jgi:tripartite-type tricarboxylate transporter receptor subunit TctC